MSVYRQAGTRLIGFYHAEDRYTVFPSKTNVFVDGILILIWCGSRLELRIRRTMDERGKMVDKY
jgi:hypothetical protein